MITTELKSSDEWLKDPRIQNETGKVLSITDHDGWRHDDGVHMDTPIHFEDFQKRFSESTVCSRNA